MCVFELAFDRISHRTPTASRCDLEPARRGLGAVSSPSGAPLGPSWDPLGLPWVALGAILEPSWGLLARSWSRLGAILGDVKRKAAMLKNHRKTQVRMAFGPSKMRPSWAKLGSKEPRSGQVGVHLGSISQLQRSTSQLFLKMLVGTRYDRISEPFLLVRTAKRAPRGPRRPQKGPQGGGAEGGKTGYKICLELESLLGPVLAPFGS